MYDDQLVTDWPQARIHPEYYNKIGDLALLHNKTFNAELHMLLGVLLNEMNKELKT